MIVIWSLLKYSAPLKTTVEPPLIWSWQEPAVAQPVRFPKNRIPLNAPDVGADSVAVTCPLMVTGV